MFPDQPYVPDNLVGALRWLQWRIDRDAKGIAAAGLPGWARASLKGPARPATAGGCTLLQKAQLTAKPCWQGKIFIGQ